MLGSIEREWAGTAVGAVGAGRGDRGGSTLLAGASRASRRWRTHALVLLGLVGTVAAAVAHRGGADWVPPPAVSTGSIAYPVVLLTASLVHFHWVRTGLRVGGWLSMILVMYGVQGIGTSVLHHQQSDVTRPGPALLDIAIALVILAAIGLAERVDLPVDPVVTGLLAGGVLLAARLLLVSSAPGPVAEYVGALLLAGLVMIDLAVAWRVLHLRSLSEGVRVRLAGAGVLLGICTAATNPGVPRGVVADVVVLAASCSCAVLLIGTAISLLMRSIEEQSSLADLHRMLSTLQSERRTDRARLHEVNASLAGLASASDLLQSLPAGSRRLSLEAMVRAELARLQRLLGPPAPDTGSTATTADVDEAVRHVVVAHQARGHQVEWSPGGLHVAARADDVTEAVNILLDNAVRHGSHRSAVATRPLGRFVEISVSDSGPGIAGEVRERMFVDGVRGPASRGQGLGLGIAHDLVHQQGGSLRLARSTTQGSTFSILLPVAPVAGTGHGLAARPA